MNTQGLRALAEKATKGEWHADKGRVHSAKPITEKQGGWRYQTWPKGAHPDIAVCESLDLSASKNTANARYIAACNPETVLAMCDEIERLGAELAALIAKK